MQTEAPEAFDLSKETKETLDLYGLNRGDTDGFGWQCLVARRLAERGVRFVELIDTGSSNNWDAHSDMAAARAAGEEDRQADRRAAHGPEAARDAGRHARRLDDRVRPDAGPGRADGPRPPRGVLLVVAGRRRGQGRASPTARPTTSGRRWPRTKVHVHDFHATILHLLGIDHEKLTYRHAGRDFRLTDVHGNVVRDILT